MDYREELFKALTAGVDGVFRDKSIEALVDVCKRARKEGYESGRNSKYDYTKGLNDAWECVRKLNSEISGESIKSIFGVPYCEVFKKFTASEAIAKVEEYEEKQEKSVFKMGDRVEVIRQLFYTSGEQLFPVGTVGKISYINHDGTYKVRTDTDWNDYPADALELANDVILVGDEVWLLDKDYHGVITAVWEVGGVVKTERLTQSGKLACDDAKDLHRTGRRFPEIANVLKQMQEGNT